MQMNVPLTGSAVHRQGCMAERPPGGSSSSRAAQGLLRRKQLGSQSGQPSRSQDLRSTLGECALYGLALCVLAWRWARRSLLLDDSTDGSRRPQNPGGSSLSPDHAASLAVSRTTGQALLRFPHPESGLPLAQVWLVGCWGQQTSWVTFKGSRGPAGYSGPDDTGHSDAEPLGTGAPPGSDKQHGGKKLSGR